MGRPYTPKEMKTIVDYLVEHRAYGEIRGRKMWVDMENARIIDRTWQSLKETFLKRILPDIHNPYYKLSVQEISSFRAGYDVAHKTNNKLEIRTGSDASSASDNGEPKEQVSGEAKCSKIQNQKRNSSTETLVLENCDDNDPRKDPQKTTKSLRDLITYSEPLTPMLQEVIDDFSSDDEPPLQIVEDNPPTPPEEQPAQKQTSPDTIRESQSYYKTTEPTNNDDETDKTQASKIKSLKLKKTQKGTWENKEPVKSLVKEKNNNDSEMPMTSEKNSTVDTQLPNNQEALAFTSQPARMSTESSASDFVDPKKKKKEKRKRSRSQGSNEPKKKKKDKQEHTNEKPNQTDTITFDSHPQAVNISKELANKLETTNNQTIEQTNKSDDTNIPPNVVAEKTNEGTSQEAGPSRINNTENPCLIPVSLYAERFSQSRYSDSDDDEPIKKSNKGDKNQEISKDNHDSNKNKEACEKNKDPKTSQDINQEKNKNEKSGEKNESLEDINSEKSKDNHASNKNEGPYGKNKEITKASSEEINQEKNKDNKESEKGESVARNKETSKAIEIRSNNHPETSKKNTEDVVLLKSHSESDSDVSFIPKKVPATVGKSRERALANVFGFSSGSVSKRNVKIGRVGSNRHRKRRATKLPSLRIRSDSGSSDSYVTENESSEYDDRNRLDRSHDRLNDSQNSTFDDLSRKYQKPPSFDIAEDGEGTHLFVVGRKKVYPVLIRNKDSLHYAKLRRADYRECFEGDSRESFWKEKFLEEQKKALEEKIRADELARLLRQANDRPRPIDSRPSSPILQPYMSFNTPSVTPRKAKRPREPSPIPSRVKDDRPIDSDERPANRDERPANRDEIPANRDERPANRDEGPAARDVRPADRDARHAERDEISVERDERPANRNGRPAERDERHEERENRPQDRVRIKFTKDKEIEFEGQWNHVTPVLEKMVAMLHSADSLRENNKNTEKLPTAETNKTANTVSDKQGSPVNAKEQNISKNINVTEPKSNKKEVISKAVTENQNSTKNSKEKETPKGKQKAVQRKPSVNSRKSSTEVIISDKPTDAEVISSGVSTPGVTQNGPEVNPSLSRLYQIENEVFKKIEAIDKAEQTIDQNGLDAIPDENITKRKRGRPKKVTSSLSTTSTESVSKQPRSRTESRGDVSPAKTLAGLAKRTRIRSVSIGATLQPSEKRLPKKLRTRSASFSRKSPLKANSLKNSPKRFRSRGDQTDDDIYIPRGVKNSGKPVDRLSGPNNMMKTNDDFRVRRSVRAPSRFSESSGASKRSGRPPSKVKRDNETQDSDDDNVRYMLRPATPKGRKRLPNRSPPHLIIPPHDSSRLSESTQGYQESNPSPIKITVKKKRKLGTIALSNKKATSSNVKRKSSPYLADDSCSTNEAPPQKSASNSTLNSEVYKSESYQILLPKTKQIAQMDKIDESPNQNATDNSNRNFEVFTPISVQVDNEFYVLQNEHRNEILKSPEENSSNVSALNSPELSVVENLTISREIISTSIEHPCLNETQMNEITVPTDCDKYMISEVDVSMPLMQQNCELQTEKRGENVESITEGVSTNTVNDSLDKRLRDLLLESAKKISEDNLKHKSPNMEVDLTNKETKTKRRSSTPRKKPAVRKTAPPKIDPVLEEHTENCSYSGRKSCPPIINVIPCLDDYNNQPIDNNNDKKLKEIKVRKKKDVLKVKITRPKRKSSTDKQPKRNRLSDSGITETESVTSECKCCDDSIELIHNHSDTCLNDDCLGDSVIFVENPSNSIISLTSSLPNVSSTEEKGMIEEFVTPENFCTNAQDATKFNNATKPLSTQSSNGDAATVYFTPPDNRSFDSLITDDLSDDPPPSHTQSNWHLFSEEDTNSKFADAQSQNSNRSNPIHYGSSLKQIFPLTYAVPDLSTISERSKENESKPVIATDSDIDAFSSLSVDS